SRATMPSVVVCLRIPSMSCARFARPALLVFIFLLGAALAPAEAAIAFVQAHSTTPQTPRRTVRVSFTSAQASGDLNVVVVGWNDSTATISSVADANGNSYVLAARPTVQAGVATLAI